MINAQIDAMQQAHQIFSITSFNAVQVKEKYQQK